MKKGILVGVILSLLPSFTYVTESITKLQQKDKQGELFKETMRDVKNAMDSMLVIANAERKLAEQKNLLFPQSAFAKVVSYAKYFFLGVAVGIADSYFIKKAKEDRPNSLWWSAAAVAASASYLFDKEGNFILHDDYPERSNRQKATGILLGATLGGLLYYYRP
jgi:hypothetical protein